MKLITLTVAALSLTACMSTIQSSEPVRLSAAQVNQIKATVVRDFFDPDAAKFRNIRAVDIVATEGSTRRVCGEVNGKNRFGAYVGFEMFGGDLDSGVFVRRDFFGPCG